MRRKQLKSRWANSNGLDISVSVLFSIPAYAHPAHPLPAPLILAHFKEGREEELDSYDMDILLIHTMAKHSKAVNVSNMSPPNLFNILLSISKESNDRKSLIFQKILSLKISFQMPISSENEKITNS